VARLRGHVLNIFGSQIEIERIFSVVGVLTNLQKCRFGVVNINSLVMIYKNWLNDAKVGCSLANEDVMKFFGVETNLLESHEIELIEVGMLEEG
jgi:hypothetical protein